MIGLSFFCYRVVSFNHIIYSTFGIIISFWQISSKPGIFLFKALKHSNIETSLASSIVITFFITFINSGIMWYGSVLNSMELFGTTRYKWDNGYYVIELERREYILIKNSGVNDCWNKISDKLIFYDYI